MPLAEVHVVAELYDAGRLALARLMRTPLDADGMAVVVKLRKALDALAADVRKVDGIDDRD